MTEAVLTVNELAERWKVDEKTIRSYIERGIVERVRNLTVVRIPLASILAQETSGLSNKLISKEMEIIKLKHELQEKTELLERIQNILNFEMPKQY